MSSTNTRYTTIARRLSIVQPDDPILLRLCELRQIQAEIGKWNQKWEKSGSTSAYDVAVHMRSSLLKQAARQLRAEVFALCQECNIQE